MGDAFLGKYVYFDHNPSLVNLLVMISQHLNGCTPIFLYDTTVENVLLEQLFQHLTIPYVHCRISQNVVTVKKLLNTIDNKCVTYVLFLKDLIRCRDIVGFQTRNKVIVIARSSQWKVYEFLATEIAQSFVNLLVIAKSEKMVSPEDELPFILYTHKLYVDGLGSSVPQVITSWMNGSLTRPQVPLFPEKMTNGFAGHRFIISIADQPPFTIKSETVKFALFNIQVIKVYSKMQQKLLSFSHSLYLRNWADIGIGGLYIIPERVGKVDVSYGHSQDCAAFISLTSTALPRSGRAVALELQNKRADIGIGGLYIIPERVDKGGWENWFENSSDPSTVKLLRYIEYVPTVEAGIKNTTSAFFWSYAFLGSKAQLDYLVRTNFTTTSKRAILHISSECFVPYSVALTFSLNSVYGSIFNVGIQRAYESGLIKKIGNDVQWEMMRSATGKLLQANSDNSRKVLEAEDRALALDDTQGMFLLLGFGYLLGGMFLLSEWLGGCLNLCKKKIRRLSSVTSLSSNPRMYDIPTPREKLDSIQYSRSSQFFDSFAEEWEDEVECDEIVKNVKVEINNVCRVSDVFGEPTDDNSNIEELREDKFRYLESTSFP
ncbi:hypothetical protein FQR65_LT08754 [Abscondita terminalis]|nr:hypothetical protein FQR65_LT08754 [Abscondita terminalis]